MQAFWFLCCVLGVVSQSTPGVLSDNGNADKHRLVSLLLQPYKDINAPLVVPPVPEGESTFGVGFGASLLRAELDPIRSVLTVNLWLRYVWTDVRLRWDPSEFGGVDVIRIPSKLLWKPDIVLYNSVDTPEISDNLNAVVANDGSVLWIPPAKLVVDCAKDGRNFSCPLKFGSWTYDGFSMDLKLYGGSEAMDTIDLKPNSRGLYVDRHIPATRNVMYYPCCAEPYPDIRYVINVRPQ